MTIKLFTLKIEDIKTMNQDFLNALKNKAATIEKPTIKPALNQQIEVISNDKALIVTIDIVQNKNRLDVYFNRIPADFIRNDLKANGFRWNQDRACWYNKDCNETRSYLKSKLGCEIDLIESAVIDASEPITEDVKTALPESDSYTKYKKQVNELVEYFQVDASDLVLIAIDNLHKKTFVNN